MRLRAITVRLQRLVRRNLVLQIGLVLGFWLAGQGLVSLTGLPVPGGVVGMLVVLLLLASRWLSVFSLRRGADWFIADMVLFFVPAALALLDHRELLGLLGIKVLVVILGGTLAVMGVTGLVADLCYRRGARDAAAAGD